MRYKRTVIILLSILILSTNLLSPVVDISEGHDHSCSPNRCLICFVSGTLQMLRELVFATVFCVVFPFIILIVGAAVHFRAAVRSISTPIRLKTKILS